MASAPSGLMDLLGVAAVLLEADGRIDMWRPQAEELFGYTSGEAAGQYAAPLLLRPEYREAAITLFAQVMETGRNWAHMVEFRNMRLTDNAGDHYALGLAIDRATLRHVERKVALSSRLVTQTPIGLAVLDTDLRHLAVNPALANMHGVPVADHIGRRFHEILPGTSFRAAESTMRQVQTG
ncbi:PAS domain-containing protein [Streptomyces sp. NPDC002078]